MGWREKNCLGTLGDLEEGLLDQAFFDSKASTTPLEKETMKNAAHISGLYKTIQSVYCLKALFFTAGKCPGSFKA